jgi:catechol 2,3-dioxygenase-like lactoylglutathione lyase family enzyme
MRFRLELFVDDIDRSIDFYVRALGFALIRQEDDYASLRRGDAELGLGPIAKLPSTGSGPGFTRERVSASRGAGVEIVLEVENLESACEMVERAG